MLRAIENPFRGTVSGSIVGDGANNKSDNGACCDRGEDGIAPVIIAHPVIATRRVIQAVIVIVAQIYGPAMRRIVSADIVARAVTITIVAAILDRAAGIGVVHTRRRIIARCRTMHDHRPATIVIVVPPIAIVRPVTAIIAWDPLYWQRLDFLFPHEDRKPLFEGKEDYAYDTAYPNSTLQGAYFMIAARAMGLDVGAMSGFSNAIVDEEFFSENGWKSNFLCNIGYADETALFQKLPRFEFDDICEVI